ncbi:MAG: hypothetical protein FJY65_02445 [Calditrichaeota bacterium]|nr:hypothetical protein [Calditrichota bacterium]
MRVLCVDIGTNSTLYLIADVNDGELTIVERGLEANGLGAGLSPGGSLGSELIEANRAILERIVRRTREYGCARSAAIGTAALRYAVNRDTFIAMAAELDIKVEVISDERETVLNWRGIFGPNGPAKFSTALDLGGGSTELAWGRGDKPEWSSSLPLGAVILARRCFTSDPPTKYNIENAALTARSALAIWQDLREEITTGLKTGAIELIGSAGTVTALAAVKYRILEYKPDIFNGLTLSYAQICAWRDRLLSMNLTARRAMPAMPTARAEYIHSGALMLAEIVKMLGEPTVTVSDRGVMFGLAYEIAGFPSAAPRKAAPCTDC